MLTFVPLPQAHIVKDAGHAVVPPPRPMPRGPLAQKAYEALAVAVGLWPLTCVIALGFAMLYLSVLYGSP